jgi:exopolysaccharide production protein ExoZ
MNQAKRIELLQVFRGLAALMVVLYHGSTFSEEHLGQPFMSGLFLFGYTGVDFFFVLSGFIIYYIHSRDIGIHSSLRPYLTKRLLRVIPVYWVVTGIKLAVIFTIPAVAKSYEQDFGVIIRSLLLLPQRNLPIIGVAWTLTYEFLFYCLFALAIVLGKRWALRLMTIWIASTFLYTAAKLSDIAGPNSVWLNTLLNERNLEFCMGCLSAHLVIHNRVIGQWTLMVIGLALFGVSAWYAAHGWVPLLYSPVFGLASFLIVTGSAAYELRHRLQIPAVLVSLGDASYSVYLTHVMFINAATLVLQRIDVSTIFGSSLTTLAVILFSVFAACAFYYIVERPLIRYLFQRSMHPKGNPLASPAAP